MDDLRELDSAATPAPWEDSTVHGDGFVTGPAEVWVAQSRKPRDAALIVALRNAFASGDLIPRSEHDRVVAEKDAVIEWLANQLGIKDFYHGLSENSRTKEEWLAAAIQATKEGEGE